MSDIYPIAVPKWGIEMVEGTISTWNNKEGDTIAKGDEVFEMESDKIVNVWDSPVDGVLRRIVAAEGDTHPVGALLGVIAAADVDDAEIDAFIANFSGGKEDAGTAEKAAAPASAARTGNDAYTRSSPSVRRLADELGVDLNTVEGTGRRGRITEDDVKAAASSGGGSAANDDVEIIPLTPIRKTIAKRLSEAKRDIPHFYLTAEFDMDGLLAHRKQLNESGEVKISINDVLVHCVAQALMDEPRVNINFVGDDIHQFKHANVAVAIATDDGLFPATMYKADTLNEAEIAQASAALGEKARSGSLAKEDISGASFTVSNLGMMGVSTFNAIVNPPMGAILALGKCEPRMVVRDGEPAAVNQVNATLSCDHRVIDGAIGASFLQALKARIDAL